MWNKPENPIPLGNLQLRLGVFVWIDRSWKEHPFLINKFRINTAEQLQQLLALGPVGIYWFPSKSTAEPGPAPSVPVPPPPVQAVDAEPFKKKNDELQRQRALSAKAEREWQQAAKATREAMLGMRDTPMQAGTKMRELTRSAAQSVSSGDVLLHMLGDKNEQGPQHHALNCMTLAMLLAKARGLPVAAIGEVALGALAHDIGKTKIPTHILRAKQRSKVEENLYRDHGRLGVELALISDAFSEGAIAAIRDHHEALDGSGFPSRKHGAAIGLSARIVAVADRYDRLCSPESPEVAPMLPANALKKMWREDQSRLDPAILAALVKLLGVYPPGTIVSLNDGSLGLVVSPGKNSLYPKVLIYDPDIPKDEAPPVDLVAGGQLLIEEALRPTDIPEDALEWINPRARLTYYFTADQAE